MQMSSLLPTTILDDNWSIGVQEKHTILAPDRHKSSKWALNFVTIFSSTTLSRIKSHLFANLLLAVSVFFAYSSNSFNFVLLTQGMSTSVHALLGGALSLLLVFRTNSAYDRFWEARKIWSEMISAVRELSCIAHSSMRGWDREHLLQLLAAYPVILLHHLRSGRAQGSKSQKEALKEILSEQDVELIWTSRHRPLAVCKMLSAIVKCVFSDPDKIRQANKRVDEATGREMEMDALQIAVAVADVKQSRGHAENMVSRLIATIANAERIVKTAVPLSYSRHTSRFLSVWCFTLPLVLVHSMKILMIPAVAIICWALFAIEEVGNIIEDPFNMPFLLSSGPPYTDELELERSFVNIRKDIMDRTPATEPLELWRELEEEATRRQSMCPTPRDGRLRDSILLLDYDVSAFHLKSRPDVRASFVSDSSQLIASEKLLKFPEDSS
uniref:Bestrophin homolog n=1 Tax=Guillardia theta TaxID=55529 RepID=A0A7S4HA92_GUITH|mmetsp:Transcript_11910/g.41049  ORF Transcript_11910/g.41049 Transcript_11910/m.41049 type:complete len:441 (+) Transcript_11910:230-1552(+)